MKGKKMPLHVYSDHPNWYDSKMYLNSKDYLDWLSSLQPCEINSYESMLINKYLLQNGFVLNNNPNPIDVTDIVEEDKWCRDGNKLICESGNCCTLRKCMSHQVLYFKQPKQVDSEIEAVEFAEWIAANATSDGHEEWRMYVNPNPETINLYTTKQLYQTFKNRKP